MKRAGRPIVNFIQSRGYAAQAKPAASQGGVPDTQEPQVTKLPSGLVVASMDGHFPVARVGFFFNAGSRYENASNYGVTHALRQSLGLTSTNTSTFAIINNIPQKGGHFRCMTTKDHLIYTAETTRDYVGGLFKFMGEAVTNCEYWPHELHDFTHPRMVYDVQHHKTNWKELIMENLHTASFRCGLGNSVVSPSYMLGHHKQKMIKEFVKTHFRSENVSVVGIGVDHESLIEAVQERVNVPVGKGPQVKAQFGSGEVRVKNRNELVLAAVAVEGAGLLSNDLMPLAILRHALGSGTYVKYGSNLATSPITKAASGATKHPSSVKCFSLNYSDSGLFGVQVVGHADDMGKILQAVLGVVKGGVSDKDIQRAKSQLKASILMSQECTSDQLVDMGIQALGGGQAVSEVSLLETIDAVTAQQVQAVAKKIASSKMSMAAIGELTNTPYLDQL